MSAKNCHIRYYIQIFKLTIQKRIFVSMPNPDISSVGDQK